jgi:uncharacterized protein YdcH (DUF465 family)
LHTSTSNVINEQIKKLEGLIKEQGTKEVDLTKKKKDVKNAINEILKKDPKVPDTEGMSVLD